MANPLSVTRSPWWRFVVTENSSPVFRHFRPPHGLGLLILISAVGSLSAPHDSCAEGACDSRDPNRIIALVEGEPFLAGEFDISLASA